MDSFVTFVATFAVLLYLSLVCRTNSTSCTGQGCFPQSRDLTTVAGASISSNSTCGLAGAEDFCVKRVCTYKCDATVPSQFHGVNLTIDQYDSDSYWKSKNFDENVVLQLDLGHSYFFTEIVATFRFEYPAAMYFAKSNDNGTSWKVLTYFSTNCQEYFGMEEVEENSRNGFDTECFRLESGTGGNPQVRYKMTGRCKFVLFVLKEYFLHGQSY